MKISNLSKKILGILLISITFVMLFIFPFFTNLIKESTVITVKDSPSEPWFLKKEKAKYALVYFGYVGCSTVCILSLNKISKIYKEIDEKRLNLPFYFINIDPNQSKELIKSFVKSYDKRFHGIYASKKQLNNLQKKFNLLIIKNKIDITHSSNLYLFKKDKEEYKLHKIYITKPYDKDLLINTISGK